MKAAAQRARAAVSGLRAQLGRRPDFYGELARLLRVRRQDVLDANRADLAAAASENLSAAGRDRLSLDERRVEAMAQMVLAVAAQPDPLGRVLEGRTLPNGMELSKHSVPIGVIGFIYESRPNVTVEAACLAVKSGNAVLLKGGREAAQSNILLETLCRVALHKAGLPEDLVQLLDSADRASARELVKLTGLVDLVIPRGGKGLIATVVSESRVPVIKHYEGNCHVYVHAGADLDMALAIVDNAKTQRPGVCNAAESLLVDRAVLKDFLPRFAQRMGERKVELRACGECLPLLPGAKPASEEDWAAEYLDLILSVRAVGGLEEACHHIERYGSHHTDAIVTRDLEAARLFTELVDSAVVLVNASTRFNDGGQFGLGAEIGISTDRLHARGPMGAGELTTYKWIAYGRGHVRAE